jgi:hypothetical protein
MPRLLPLALVAAAIASPSASQVASPMTEQAATDPFLADEAKAVVENLAAALEKNFVFPAAAKAYAAKLRANLASGAYDSFPDAKAFAEQVTADLQAVHKDGHLHLHIIPPKDRGGSDAAGPIGLPDGSAITKSGWLAPGVAYVSFSMFPGNEATLAELRRFLDDHRDAKTLIIDARGHRGGGVDEMDLILGEIFSEPTELLTMDTRRAADEEVSDPASIKIVPTSEDVVRRIHTALPDSTPTELRKAQIYYLTSKRTASAGEHLALALKRTHRATLIGETTRGAGHYGSFVPVGSFYAAFIPNGRTFDPDTGEGWEGIGVAPDVTVAADDALNEALRRVGIGVTGEAALAALR